MERALDLYAAGDNQWNEWNRTQDPAALDRAVAFFLELRAISPERSVRARAAAALLGLSLAARYLLNESATDRDEAIGHLTALTSDPDPERTWDGHRLTLAQLLLGRSTVGALPERPGEQSWQDLEAAARVASTIVGSKTLTLADRELAHGLHKHTAALLALVRARRQLEAGEQPDLAELSAARGALPADDPYSPALSMLLGVALGQRALAAGQAQDRRQAIEYLAEGLEGSIDSREAGNDPDEWHSYALWHLVALVFVKTPSDVTDLRAPQLLRAAARALQRVGLADEEAALWHALSAQAHYACAIGARRVEETEQALASVRASLDLLPAGHDLRGPLMMFASVLLYYRFLAGGSLADGDAATAYLRATSELAHLEPGQNADGGDGTDTVTELLDVFSTIGLDPAGRRLQDPTGRIALRLRQALAALPDDNDHRYGVMALLGAVLLENFERTGDVSAAKEGLSLLAGAADQCGEDNPYHAHLNDSTAMWQGRIGAATRDIRLIDDAISRVSRPIARPGLVPGERLRRLRTLGGLLGERYTLSRKSRDLDRSIRVLAYCRRYTDQEPSWRSAALFLDLAENYRIRGLRLLRDPRKAIETGMEGLRAAAADVILQTGTRRALTSARGVQSWARNVAWWCLIEDRLVEAVQALELGRSLVLHAATVAADVPGLLRTAGHDDLAARWQAESGRVSPLFDFSPLDEAERDYLSGVLGLPADEGAPSDIRRQVLAAFGDAPAIADLLAPPAVDDMTAALRGTGYDAFVYLLPPDPAVTRNGEPRPGCALVVRADGGVQEVPLPLLAEEPVAAYDAAQRAWIGNPDDLTLIRRWNNDLEGLCGWAWGAMAGPVLSHVARWQLPRLPRLVIVPTGILGNVPWHAARTTGSDGVPHYAIEDAVFGYAASARQLISAGRRDRRPWADLPVLLADTTGDLPVAAVEADELQRTCYPTAVLLGQSGQGETGAGTTEEVLARLPGGSAPQATLLHCCCHASVLGDLSSSFLQLDQGQRLTVAQIMAQAQGRDPGAPGYLAVLSACTSDFTDVDHDESLTLSSALLATGATGVIGTRWPVGDLAAAELMLAFHYFLGREPSPPDALRAAQLWALSADGSFPEGMSLRLANRVTTRTRRLVRNWAAFTYQGVAILRRDQAPARGRGSDDRDLTPRPVDPRMMIKQDASAASALTPLGC